MPRVPAAPEGFRGGLRDLASRSVEPVSTLVRPSGVTKTMTRDYPGDQRCTVHSGRKPNAGSGWWAIFGFVAVLLAFGVYANVSEPDGDPGNLPDSSYSTWADQPTGEVIRP